MTQLQVRGRNLFRTLRPFPWSFTVKTLARIRAMNPMGRLGEVPDIANVVSFLAGPDSAWVTGQIVRANGGVV